MSPTFPTEYNPHSQANSSFILLGLLTKSGCSSYLR
jgi:hypothetical protein